ncbi:MAG: tryptophan 2,3-dioxygenase [Bacteroidetes bacterium]|nr:tryptophan 2,3-dioxygenase [Bacteroidota bacterium]
MEQKKVYYHDYLHLDKILDAQYPESDLPGNEPAHDEMFFIIIHQAYELWFKLILFELDFIISVFKKEKIDDNSEDLNLVRHRLNRINKILNLLTTQITLLDTMTPLDFLEFRNLLVPASGFQSVQFRLIEARLGLQMENRFNKEYYKRTNEGGFAKNDFDKINDTEKEKSLLILVNEWLERMPFFEKDLWKNYQSLFPVKENLHPFWSDYRHIYQSSLNEREANKIEDFDRIFFPIIDSTEGNKDTLLSPRAMRAALFIMLYRDFPVFQTTYQILDGLIEMDNQLSNWRHKHIDMVRRMIGLRMGTGNTSGRGYLEGALNSHYIFKDLSSMATFLFERKRLPVLPTELIKKMSYSD